MAGIECGISGMGTVDLKGSASATRKISRSSIGRLSMGWIEKQEFVGAYYEADGNEED